MQFDIILAMDTEGGIGRNNQIPWDNTPIGLADKRWFQQKTTQFEGTAVIMGRKTWQSLSKPLVGRINIVVTRNKEFAVPEGVQKAASLQEALEWCETYSNHTFIIGGSQLYFESFKHPSRRFIYMTKIENNFQCDTFVDTTVLEDYNQFTESISLSFGPYHFPKNVKVFEQRTLAPYHHISYYYPKTNPSEVEYLRLLKEITDAPVRNNRTNVTTRGVFARSLRFPLCDEYGQKILPLATTKFTSFKSIYHELIWFLRGSTDTTYLKEHCVTIWDGNSSRAFLDSRGLQHYPEGATGPGYGYQWRNWNGMKIDQISNLIDGIKKKHWDRRHLVIAWNPGQNDEMALPPCHYSFQMYVEPDEQGNPKWLSCNVNMRSWDISIGGYFNICSYGLLTHMIAQICGLTAKELVINACDVHIYENNIAAVQEQLTRTPVAGPRFEFSYRVIEKQDLSIDDFTWTFSYEDMKVIDYFPQPPIKMEMVV